MYFHVCFVPPFSQLFLAWPAYNCPTIQKPVIYQFCENVHPISYLVLVVYRKVKIWQRIQLRYEEQDILEYN